MLFFSQSEATALSSPHFFQMFDLALLTVDDLVKELRGRCDTMVFLARLNDSDEECHKVDIKGWESDALGLMDDYRMFLQARKTAEFIFPNDDDDGYDGFLK